MPEVEWALATKRPDGGSLELWTRTVNMDFLPPLHESCVHILRSDEEPEGTFAHRVKGIWWSVDGKTTLDFYPIIIDPNEEIEKLNPWNHMTPWRSSIDGPDLDTELEASGWTRWGEVD